MDSLNNLSRAPLAIMNLGGNKDRGSAKAIRASSGSHPGSIHWLDESNGCVSDLPLLISELKFWAKRFDEQRWINKRNLLGQVDMVLDNFEAFVDPVHIGMNSICEIYQKMGGFVHSASHIQTSGRHNFSISTGRNRMVVHIGNS